MDPNNGSLHLMSEEEAKRRGYVPVRRDLTEVEKARMQIDLYSPCACGSGKKLKFCCFRKPGTGKAS